MAKAFVLHWRVIVAEDADAAGDDDDVFSALFSDLLCSYLIRNYNPKLNYPILLYFFPSSFLALVSLPVLRYDIFCIRFEVKESVPYVTEGRHIYLVEVSRRGTSWQESRSDSIVQLRQKLEILGNLGYARSSIIWTAMGHLSGNIWDRR